MRRTKKKKITALLRAYYFSICIPSKTIESLIIYTEGNISFPFHSPPRPNRMTKEFPLAGANARCERKFLLNRPSNDRVLRSSSGLAGILYYEIFRNKSGCYVASGGFTARFLAYKEGSHPGRKAQSHWGRDPLDRIRTEW